MTPTQLIGLIPLIITILYALWAIGQAEDRGWKIVEMKVIFVFLVIASILGLILIFS